MGGQQRKTGDVGGIAALTIAALALASIGFAWSQPSIASVSVIGIPLWLARGMIAFAYLLSAIVFAVAAKDFHKVATASGFENMQRLRSRAFRGIAVAMALAGLATCLAFLTRNLQA